MNEVHEELLDFFATSVPKALIQHTETHYMF